LPKAEHTLEVLSPKSGFLTAIQCEQTGIACVVLGGGRERKEDSVDPSVGFVLHKKVGDKVSAGESLCTVHYNSEERAARAKALLDASFQVGEAPPAKLRPLIHRVIAKSGEKN
jgi:thymidine phosphorylase